MCFIGITNRERVNVLLHGELSGHMLLKAGFYSGNAEPAPLKMSTMLSIKSTTRQKDTYLDLKIIIAPLLQFYLLFLHFYSFYCLYH